MTDRLSSIERSEVSTVSVPLGIVVARRTLARFFPVGTLGCLLDGQRSTGTDSTKRKDALMSVHQSAFNMELPTATRRRIRK